MRAPTLITALVLTLLPCAANGVLPEQPRREASPTDSVLVKYRPGVTAQQIRLHADSLGIEMVRGPGARGGPLGKLRVPPAEQARLLRELNASGLVEFAEPNYRRYPHINKPEDPRFDEQWVMDTLAMAEAWDITTGDGTVKIAIIDDGVDAAHDDLEDNVSETQACFGPDDFCGGDPDNGDPRSADDAHGTLVAGQAGAVGDNDVGITGTAWTVEIVPIRTDLTVDYIVEAIDFAIDNDVHIINASYGGPSLSEDEYAAVERAQTAGILFVTSAGNSHTDNDKGRLSFPQAFDLDNVLTVAASDPLDQLTRWAQHGQTTVDVAAGGEGILSTNAGIADGGDYLSASGSSFASPLVAGIAALIRSEFDEDYKGMKARIVAGSEMTNGLRGRVAGGRANALNALTWDLDNDPVLVIESIAVDDAANGNGNEVLDAGETADLVVGISSLWGAAPGLGGTLAVESGDAFVELVDDDADPVALADGGDASLRFRVSVPASFSGNERVMFRLDLTWDGDGTTRRWFEHELGVLTPNASQLMVIGRTRHEQYHAFHLDVPAGVTDLRIDTATGNEYDVDLLVHHGEPPQYQINLGEGPDSDNGLFAYQPREEVEVSGRFDGDETVVFDEPAQGTYHLVIVNYGLGRQTYGISTSWCTADGCTCDADACAGRARFLQQSVTSGATGEQAIMSVVRQNGSSGTATVAFQTVGDPSELDNAATPGVDYTATNGTLSWGDGDTAAKTFSIPLLAERTAGRAIRVRLFDPTGVTLGSIRHSTVTIEAATSPPPGGGGDNDGDGGGGGGSVPWWSVAGLAGLAMFRRRRPA